MILGRNPALWLALLAAILNISVVVVGWQLSAEQIAAINAGFIAIIGFVANEKDPTTLPTFAMSTSVGKRAGDTSSSGTGS